AADARQKTLRRDGGQLVYRLRHHGERWLDDGCPVQIVEAQDRHLVGGDQATAPDGEQRAEGHVAVGGKDSRGTLLDGRLERSERLNGGPLGPIGCRPYTIGNGA